MKTLLKKLVIIFSMLCIQSSLKATTQYFGYAQQGGASVSVVGFSSITRVQRSFPGATIAVYTAGTTTLVPLYFNSTGTVKANPFVAGSDASFTFFIGNGIYDFTFSGNGITIGCGTVGKLPCIPAFTWSGISIGSIGSNLQAINVLDLGAKCDGVTDDAAAIQTGINTVVASGGELYFPPGVCIVKTELSAATNGKVFHLIGSGAQYPSSGTTIRAGLAGMRSVLAAKSGPHRIEEIRFDANYLATYAVYFSGASNEGSAFSRLKEVHGTHALKDGFFWDFPNAINDNTLLDTVWAYSNGTISATSGIRGQYQCSGSDCVWRTQLATGTVSTVSGSNIITGAGTSFTSLGLRSGDFVRVGSTLLTADYLQVQSVDSTTQITCYNLSTATTSISGAQYAAFVGDGVHFGASGGQNGIMRVNGGLFRANAGSGIAAFSQYGHEVRDAQLENNGLWGITLATADSSTPTALASTLDHLYFEGNMLASIWIGHVRGYKVGPINSGDPTPFKSAAGVSFRTNSAYNIVGPFPVLGFATWETDKFNMLGNVAHNGYVQSYFVFELANVGGVLKHRIVCDAVTTDTARGAGKINAYTNGLTVTPAVDATHGFSGGAGIVGGNTILFDTADQLTPGVSDFRQDLEASVSLVRNGTGAPAYPEIYFRQDNINGVTIWRPALQVMDTADNVLTLNTTLLGANRVLSWRVRVGLR